LYDNGMRHVYVSLRSEEEVARLRPDLERLDLPPDLGINCFAGSGTGWKTRMFAPGGGIAEDPATGSAAGPLALHLARHGGIAFARPGGRPPPASCQLLPASCETARGGRRSRTATTVEPSRAAATSSGSSTRGCAVSDSSAPATKSTTCSVSASIVYTPSPV